MFKRIMLYCALASLIFIGADRALTQTETAIINCSVIFPIEPMSLSGNFLPATWHDMAWGVGGVIDEDDALALPYHRDLVVNIGGYDSADLSYMVSSIVGLPVNPITELPYTNLIKAHGHPDSALYSTFNGAGTPEGDASSGTVNFIADSTEYYNLVMVTVPDILPGTYTSTLTWTLTAN